MEAARTANAQMLKEATRAEQAEANAKLGAAPHAAVLPQVASMRAKKSGSVNTMSHNEVLDLADQNFFDSCKDAEWILHVRKIQQASAQDIRIKNSSCLLGTCPKASALRVGELNIANFSEWCCEKNQKFVLMKRISTGGYLAQPEWAGFKSDEIKNRCKSD